MAATSKNLTKKVHIDFLRIIAIYMVLFNHTGTNGFVLYTIARESPFYPFYLFNAIFIKIAVPLFFMITGALLLNREESIKEIIKGRFLKYAAVLVVISAIMYVYYLRSSLQDLSLWQFLEKLYTSRHSVALWYLYAYLAYLLMLPLLRKLAKGMTNTEYVWMFCMFGGMKLLSLLDFAIWKGEAAHNGSFAFFITTDYVFYPLMGYFVEHRLKEKDFNGKNLLALSALSFAAIVVCCCFSHYRSTLLGAWEEGNCQTFFNTLIFLPTVTVYYAAKMFFMRNKVSDKTKRLLSTLGGTTFGLYLLEAICRTETKAIFDYLRPILHTLPACWIWMAAACILGMGITYFLKKIPILNKFI